MKIYKPRHTFRRKTSKYERWLSVNTRPFVLNNIIIQKSFGRRFFCTLSLVNFAAKNDKQYNPPEGFFFIFSGFFFLKKKHTVKNLVCLFGLSDSSRAKIKKKKKIVDVAASD